MIYVAAIGGALAIYCLKERRYGSRSSYPSWSGQTFGPLGEQFPNIKIPYLKIDDDGEIFSKDFENGTERYKIRGWFFPDGRVEFTKKNYTKRQTIEFKGRVVAHGRIEGQWNIIKGGFGYGTFNLQMDNFNMHTMVRMKDNRTFHDRISIAFSPNGEKFRGVGVDQLGFYIMRGYTRSTDKIEGTLIYPGKFTVEFDGRRDVVTGDYEGNWKIDKGGKGKFCLRRDNLIQAPNVPQFNYHQQNTAPHLAYPHQQMPQLANPQYNMALYPLGNIQQGYIPPYNTGQPIMTDTNNNPLDNPLLHHNTRPFV